MAPVAPSLIRKRAGRSRPASACAVLALGLLPAAAVLTGCTRDGRFQAISMWNESRLRPLQESPMPGIPSSSLPVVPGTVAQGEPAADDPLVSGRTGGKLVSQFPIPVTEDIVRHGQDRFNIYCSPCHGRLGNGEGMIVKRGFPHPPDYEITRLQQAPVGHFFDVVTNGYGVMYSYAARVPVKDRWAIAAYIRVLQKINRPVIPEVTYKEERLRARATGVGTRPVRS